ncbi:MULTISPECIES: cytochrome b [Variovorax]|jgi:cytochrome b561|uniref:cytochrome b n=1 Tax=Variovorax TaxID=34072 RepID=UPI0003601665|nr:cytochrome b/b6 domain-containing protein [Variovorax paradoxus]MBW8719721.1 cytochrome b [Variovorax paradoxus]
MSWKNSTSRYGAAVIGLHWLMLLLLAAVYACMELRGFAPKGSELRSAMKSLHFLLGLGVLALVLLRLAVRWSAGAAPGIHPAVPDWQDRLAGPVHFALYVFMIATPILGWMTLSAEGQPIALFGLPVPSLVDANEALADQLQDVHEALATAGYFLIGLHAAAALAHHYLFRDDTLSRMLPRRGSRQGAHGRDR